MKIHPEVMESLQLTAPHIDCYEWVFVQAEQIIKKRCKGDDGSKALFHRRQLFLQTLPDGMRGINLMTWSTLTAEGMRRGKPLDCRYSGDRCDTVCPGCVRALSHTVLDEEGEFPHPSGGDYYIIGTFNEMARSPELYPVEIYHAYPADFRAMVSGFIEETP